MTGAGIKLNIRRYPRIRGLLLVDEGYADRF